MSCGRNVRKGGTPCASAILLVIDKVGRPVAANLIATAAASTGDPRSLPTCPSYPSSSSSSLRLGCSGQFCFFLITCRESEEPHTDQRHTPRNKVVTRCSSINQPAGNSFECCMIFTHVPPHGSQVEIYECHRDGSSGVLVLRSNDYCYLSLISIKM